MNIQRWIGACVASFTLASTPALAAPDWVAVGGALGKAGTVQADGVYRVAFPRSDLHVSLDGVDVKPALALGSWVAFQDMGAEAMVMGDLVLTHEEVNSVMRSLASNGIEITALHNHLLRASPATMYMHIEGHGDPIKLAVAIKDALQLSRTPFVESPASSAPPTLELDMAEIDKILHSKGNTTSGVYQFSIGRKKAPTSGGMVLPNPMGSTIAINFQPTGGGKAAIAGDFVLTASEVNPVMRTLQARGIEVTALHNHMLNDKPRLFFMHFWANDDAVKLARGLEAALDDVAIARK
jgi:hypothetical protein